MLMTGPWCSISGVRASQSCGCAVAYPGNLESVGGGRPGNHLGVQMSGTGPAPSRPADGDPWRLDGRVALVTGASAGLGARFARVLHQAGAQVLATARRTDLLEDLARECGERMQVMPVDNSSSSHRQALARQLSSR